jgi:hypothetical protein
MPLWLMARPEHMDALMEVEHPFLLVNKHNDENSDSLAPTTHELMQLAFNPKIIQDFCNYDTMAIPLKKSHRNLSSLITLGRSAKADIVISSMEVSKLHCGFYRVDGNWYVLDLDSTNGIVVDTYKSSRVKLSSQSIITLGNQVNMAFITAIDLGLLVAEIDI